MNTLDRLAELEARYDGPIPAYLLSPPGVHALLTALGNLRFYAAQVRFQCSAIRARRTLGLPVEDYMRRDLALYWRQRRKYQAESIRLGRVRYVRAA